MDRFPSDQQEPAKLSQEVFGSPKGFQRWRWRDWRMGWMGWADGLNLRVVAGT